ncbi:hypothetical protein HGA34_04820 [Candidatus Falkowbacteria bacterium]|nr:hypothetical protein [Candidatus Falkowbacteria bacterium]
MLQLSRGQVKFFGEEGFGYVVEEHPKKKREVFFRSKHFAGPVERHLGKLDFDLASRLPYRMDFRPPTRSDELVYLTMWTDRGPMAKYWGFAADWEKASRRISMRLSPDSVLVRVKQVIPERGIAAPQIVWEGELDKFMFKLEHGFASTLNQTAVIEQCRATGWMAIEDPSTWHPQCLKLPLERRQT